MMFRIKTPIIVTPIPVANTIPLVLTSFVSNHTTRVSITENIRPKKMEAKGLVG